VRSIRQTLSILTFLIGSALVVAPLLAASPMTNRVIVKLHNPASAGFRVPLDADHMERLKARAGMSLRRLRTMSDGSQVLELPARMTETRVAEVARRLAADPGVAAAEPDRMKHPVLVPNDTNYFLQWALFDATGGLRLPQAWDQERGAASVVIGLVDTGIIAHADMDTARQVPGFDFVSDPFTANDGDGRDPDPTDPGDAVTANECGAGEPAEDSSWHGTQIAGVVGATTDNALDIAAVNHGSRFFMARALGKCGGFTSDTVDAMRWAAGLPVSGVPANPNPARVVNLSFGGPGPCSGVEQAAINSIVAAGAVVIVAAGNEGGSVAASSPANCTNVITVAATTRAGARASFTNVGPEVEVSSPGGELGDGVLSLFNAGAGAAVGSPGGDALAFVAGTSVASALVSGVAALMFSANSLLSPAQIRDLLQTTARDFPDNSCTTANCGAGIVDASAAVQAAFAAQGQVSIGGSSGGGGGGGGCTASQRTDMGLVWPLIIFLALVRIVSRRRLQR